MAFVDELASYGDQVTIVPQDEMGMLDLESVLGTHLGARWSIAAVPKASSAQSKMRELAARRLHLERFSAKPQEPAARSGLIVRACVGTLRPALQVPPDKSVLDVIEPQALAFLHLVWRSLRNVRDRGDRRDVDHRDSVLNEEEQAANRYMMVCVSRCRSPD